MYVCLDGQESEKSFLCVIDEVSLNSSHEMVYRACRSVIFEKEESYCTLDVL